MKVTVHVYHAGGKIDVQAEEGEKLTPVLRPLGLMDFPCGVGKCGKCRIYADTVPTREERELLGDLTETGLRLACFTGAKEGLSIHIPGNRSLRVLTTLARRTYSFAPFVTEKKITFTPPAVEDQRSDLCRVLQACGAARHSLPPARFAALPDFVHENTQGYAVLRGKTLLNFSRSGIHHALTVDIGTTTIAAHLTDLSTNTIVAEHGEPNAQAPYGADVISRIRQDSEWRENGGTGRPPLQDCIVEQINGILSRMRAKFHLEDVAVIAVTGNTTMLHLFCGLPAIHIGRAPFTPVFLEEQRLPAREPGVDSDAPLLLLPGIASYVGADIVASMITAEATKQREPFLLLDIGTNAETVLGVDGKFYTCSAAAGPCFEGATLDCGMTGQSGAIDAVSYDEEPGFTFTTLGGEPARGLCGSGVLSCMALLLEHGLIDESGALNADGTALGRRVHNEAFYLTETIYFSQKDVREVQMAKAAVRAGIDRLLAHVGIGEKDVRRLFLAGGFGSALSPRDAARTGLFPEHLAQHVHVLGNAAGMGALRYITEKGIRGRVRKMRAATSYIELSSDPGFTSAYVERMFFPEEI